MKYDMNELEIDISLCVYVCVRAHAHVHMCVYSMRNNKKKIESGMTE